MSLKMVKQGDFAPGVNLKAMVRAGLVPEANFKLHERQTKTVEADVKKLAIQSYVMPRLLTPTPVSYFEGAREWHKEKEMGDPHLSMSMSGKRLDAMELESFSTLLPGLTHRYGYSWRELGMSRAMDRPLDSLTSRRAILRVLKAANNIGLEGVVGQDIKGLINEVSSNTTVTATAVWSDATNAKPFEDIVTAMQKVAEQDIDVSGWNVAIHPTNMGELLKVRSDTDKDFSLALIRQELGDQIRLVQTTAIPEGTILGVPRDAEYADLLTTGLPDVVTVKADAEGVEAEVRMIAIPRVIEDEAAFKITSA